MNRKLSLLLILALLVTLCLYYAMELENHRLYPSYGTILSDYPQGEVVYVYGEVVRNYPSGYVIEENYHGQLVTMRISTTTPVAMGDKVSVRGVLGPGSTIIQVVKVDVNEKWRYQFLILRSFLVFIFLVSIFFHYWLFDPKKFEFRRR